MVRLLFRMWGDRMKIRQLNIMSIDFSSPKMYKLSGRAKEILQSEKIYRFSSLLTCDDVSYDVVLAQGENVKEQLKNVKALFSYNKIGEDQGSALMYLSPNLDVDDVYVSSQSASSTISFGDSYVDLFSVYLKTQDDLNHFFNQYGKNHGDCVIGGVFPSEDAIQSFSSEIKVGDVVSYPYVFSGNVYRVFSTKNLSAQGHYLFDGYFNGLSLHPTAVCKVKK